MPLLAGTHLQFANSMAEAMQQAFTAEWPHLMPDQPAPPPSNQMRLLFMAVAQGVVQHLAQHPEAFTVQVRDLGNHPLPASLTIAQDPTFTSLA